MSRIPKINISRKRGDTKRIPFNMRANGVPVDLSGWSLFELEVHSVEFPVDGTTLILAMTGQFATDGTDGVIYFAPSQIVADALTPGIYYYDAQAIDTNSEKCTFVEGTYTIVQDITKA